MSNIIAICCQNRLIGYCSLRYIRKSLKLCIETLYIMSRNLCITLKLPEIQRKTYFYFFNVRNLLINPPKCRPNFCQNMCMRSNRIKTIRYSYIWLGCSTQSSSRWPPGEINIKSMPSKIIRTNFFLI